VRGTFLRLSKKGSWWLIYAMKLLGNGAFQGAVRWFLGALRALPACSLARLFFHFSNTTSTMEQFQCIMNMNVNIPPRPMINATWTWTLHEHERYHPPPPHDQSDIISVTWSWTYMSVNIPSHPTPSSNKTENGEKKKTTKHPGALQRPWQLLHGSYGS
jgi:hypothetical protein